MSPWGKQSAWPNVRCFELSENLSCSKKTNVEQLARVISLETELNEKVTKLDTVKNSKKKLSDFSGFLQELGYQMQTSKKLKKEVKRDYKKKLIGHKEKQELFQGKSRN